MEPPFSPAVWCLGVLVIASCRAPERQRVETPLDYEVRGSGPTIAFANGTGLTHRMWEFQLAALEPRRTVLLFDGRGTGRSELPTEPFDPRLDLARLVVDLGLGPVWLMGQSGGASFAIDFTLAHPELVRGLVLAAPGVGGFEFPPEEGARFGRYAAASAGQGHAESIALMLTDPYLSVACEQPELAERLRAIYLDNPTMWNPDAVRFAERLEPPAIERLDEIRVPTLILVGDRDLPHITDICHLLLDGIEGAELETIAGAGHLVNMERPDEFNALVAEFLAAHAP